MRTLFLAVVCSSTLALVAAVPRASGSAGRPGPAARAATAAQTAVNIDNFSFTPPTITVKAGGQVTWTNHDDVPHKVVSTARTFTSSVLDTDGRYSYTFDKPGTYEYYCSLHPMMTGKVIVK